MYQQALDAARVAYRMEGGDRKTELERLAVSYYLPDRIAADLVRRWDDDKAARL